jgi:hypothetical protein
MQKSTPLPTIKPMSLEMFDASISSFAKVVLYVAFVIPAEYDCVQVLEFFSQEK